MTSQFFITYRLIPATAFQELDAAPRVKFDDGYELQFSRDLAWVSFEASSTDWEKKRAEGVFRLRTYLSAVTLIKQYTFGAEPIQWVEIRQQKGEPKYILGRLSSDEPVAKAKPPPVTADDFRKVGGYAILSGINPFFRRAMIDYSVALSFMREGVVFLSRAIEAVEGYFMVTQPVPPSGKRRQKSRDLMRKALCLPNKELIRFFTIANETTLARHAKSLNQFPAATEEELRFCAVFCRTVIERFARYLQYENRDSLKKELPLPDGRNPIQEFKEQNVLFQQVLASIWDS